MDINWNEPPRTEAEFNLFILTIKLTRSDNYAYGIMQKWIKKYGNPFQMELSSDHELYYYVRLARYIILNLN